MIDTTTTGATSNTTQGFNFAYVAVVQHFAPWGVRQHYGRCDEGCAAFMRGPHMPATSPQVALAAALAVLALPADTSKDALRKRYRELAREHHPDAGGDEGEMKRINAAYDTVRRLLSG